MGGISLKSTSSEFVILIHHPVYHYCVIIIEPGPHHNRCMKTSRRPRLIILLLVITTLLVVFRPGIGFVSANDTGKAPDSVLPAQVQVVTCDNTCVEPEPVESSSPAGVTPAQAVMSKPEPLNSDILPVQTAVSEPESLISGVLADNDTQWALNKIGIYELWQTTTGNQEVLVAVLDTGIDSSHEDLNGQVVAEANFTDSPTPGDVHGHGTHIAGIIAAKNNDIGIIGMAPDSRLLNAKVADDMGRCRASALAEGIVWAVDNGASVINISVEIRGTSSELEKAIDYAWSEGSLVVAAAGNDGNDSPVYPAGYDNCVAVAATNQDDGLAVLSNHGDWVDVAAPGFGIYSTLPDDGYGLKTGTSFACAYVSGMAALLFDIVVDTNGDGRLNDEVRAAIETGCQAIDIAGVGSGRIDAAGAVAQVYDIS